MTHKRWYRNTPQWVWMSPQTWPAWAAVQSSATLNVKKCFLMLEWNFLWFSFRPLLLVRLFEHSNASWCPVWSSPRTILDHSQLCCLWISETTVQHLHLHIPSSGSYRMQCFPTSISLKETSPEPSAAPCRTCLLALHQKVHPPFPTSGHVWGPSHPSSVLGPSPADSAPCEAAAMLTSMG